MDDGQSANLSPSSSQYALWSKKTRARELISRAVACLDIYVLHTKPRYYGPRVEIRVASAD